MASTALARRHSGRGLRSSLLAIAGVLVVAGSTMAASATSPTIYTGRGGSASTMVETDTTRHSILIRAYLTQDNGGSQWVGARVRLYSGPAGAWADLGWKTGKTMDVYSQTGATTYFDRFASGIAPGWYYVRMEYGWYTPWGWDVRGQDVGWFLV